MSALWWQRGVIYQIYPRSFQDSNGDGVGDLRGIIERLPYLVELGVDAVWLSPVFPSPMADFGYDVSNYIDIDPLFGSLADFDALIETAHGHGLKILLDLVPNHTSDQHPWFRESRSSRHNRKRDWYLWRDPASDGGPPNNWLSEFGGPAWEYDSETGQYYYHAFLAAQPDLNWRNPEVAHAIYEVMRFWMRRGVDGFRVDVLWHLLKDEHFRDNPPNPDFREGEPPHRRLLPLYTTDLPEVQTVVRGLRRVVDEFPDRVLIGEIYLPIERLVAYYGRKLEGTHLPFNFSLLETQWNARAIARLVDEYEGALPAGGWPNWVLGNHDRPRIASRVGRNQARIAAMLLLTLRGTPTMYYGDEIGMVQVPIPRERIRDPFERNVPGLGLGRDGARTPMQWDTGANAGFSQAEPWLPLAEDFRQENVANQQREPGSMLNLYLRLIAERRRRAALTFGSYRPIVASGDLMLFAREYGEERILVALNFADDPAAVTFSSAPLFGRVLVSAFGDRDGEKINDGIDLRACEGLVLELTPASVIPTHGFGAPTT
ncbi:MAG TPA: alpha-amylase family glycosyl hydrolase [Xanthobacteraceae bacterium]|nr:alpha-amylase family glycosyl hydrolase [Xanthobacteraceae bacterium]